MATDGTVIASIPAGGVSDLAGNTNTVSTSTDNTVTFSIRADLNDVVGAWGCTTCAWAVGDNGTILYGNATAFSAQVSGVTADLNGVTAPYSGDDGHVWAVGDNGTILECTTSCTSAAAVWTKQVSNTTADLYAVGGARDGGSSVWAVGAGGVIDHWDGTTWTPQTIGSNDLLGTGTYERGTPGTAWVVGAGGTMLDSANGTTWGTQTIPAISGNSSYTLRSVSSYDNTDKNVWAAGNGGVILRTTNGGTWTQVGAGVTASNLFGVSASATSASAGSPVYAVGAGGTILTSADGATFTARTSGTTMNLFGVNWNTGGIAWAVGQSGTILYTANSGASWTPGSYPAITLTPSSGTSGTTGVSVAGSGFSATTAITIKFNGLAPTSSCGTTTVAGALPATCTFTVPASPGCTLCPVTVTAGAQAVTYFTVFVAPAITSANAKTFTLNSPGTFTVTATGTPAPTFSETGPLPTGVLLDPSTGVLSGTPTGSTGNFPITLKASNGVGSDATQSFTLTVGSVPAITSADTATFTAGTVGTTFQATATGFPAPTFAETGALPSGLSFNSAGLLSGTPAAGTGGTYPLTMTATNSAGSSPGQSFTLTVTQAPAFTSANAASFSVGVAGSFTVTATGFPAPTFSQTGSLPTGVTLTSAGVLAGTPAAGTAGSYPIVITAADGVGSNPTQSFTLTVSAVTVGASSSIQWIDQHSPTTSPSAVATVNGDSYLVLIYEHNAMTPASMAVTSGAGTPFSSCSSLASEAIDPMAHGVAFAFECTGNGTTSNKATVSVTTPGQWDLATFQIVHLNTGVSVPLTGVDKGTATPAVATLSSAPAGDGEIVLVALDGDNNATVTPPSGMTLLGVQEGAGTGGGYTVDAYLDAQAQTSASFAYTGMTPPGWGAVALELGP